MSSFITSLLMPIYLFLGLVNPISVGTSVTTINGTDTLSNSRTTINDNFTALNNGKIENSTTSLPLLTSASGLATVGTITSGTWNATAISVAKGGTGTTSPTQYHTMVGGGSSGLVAVSPGTAGQFLTSNGASAYPTYQSASVDQSQSYTWTGGNMWTASSTHLATTTISASSVTGNALVLNGVNTQWPSANSVGFLYNNGSGVYSIPTIPFATGKKVLAAGTAQGTQTITTGFQPKFIKMTTVSHLVSGTDSTWTSFGTATSSASQYSLSGCRDNATGIQNLASTTAMFFSYIDTACAVTNINAIGELESLTSTGFTFLLRTRPGQTLDAEVVVLWEAYQ